MQRHVILQFAEAREAQLSKANRKNEQLLDEAQQIKRQIASVTQTSERAQTDLAQAHDGMSRLPLEREAVMEVARPAV